MFLHEVVDGVAAIEMDGGDNEGMHRAQDDLYLAVLTAIATGQCKDAPPEDFALAALEAEKIKYTKWYA